MTSFKYLFAASACAILGVSNLFGAQYVLESNGKATGTTDFSGFGTVNYTATPEIPAGGITSADDVKVTWFSDIKSVVVDVNKFEFEANGYWNDGGFSIAGSSSIRAKEIIFTAHYGNKEGAYSTDNTNVKAAGAINIYNNNVLTLNGTLVDSNAMFQVGTSYSSNAATLNLGGYDSSSVSAYTINNFSFNYGSNGNSSSILNINENVNVSAYYIFFSSSSRTGSSTINFNGGTLTLKSQNASSDSFKVRSDNDNVTINHGNGTFAFENTNSFGISNKNSVAKYNLGSNSIFKMDAGKSFTIENGVTLGTVSGQKGGMKVSGGGTLKLACAVSAVNGTVAVVEKSALDLGSSWVSNAESVSVSAGSTIVTTGDIALSDASQLILSVASETDFASITGASISTSGSKYGSLIFDIDSAAFDGKTSISIALSSLIGAGAVDWSKFDISAGEYAAKIDGSNITFSVPEPATYAAIFGALALCFVAYRRRK